MIRGLGPEALDIMAKTMYAEARGEGEIGMKAVAHVILNRLAKQGWMGKTIAEVCLKPDQFTVWNEENRERTQKPSLDTSVVLRRAYRIALETMEEDVDITFGSTHFHHKDEIPAWAMGKYPIFVYKNHYFYNNIE